MRPIWVASKATIGHGVTIESAGEGLEIVAVHAHATMVCPVLFQEGGICQRELTSIIANPKLYVPVAEQLVGLHFAACLVHAQRRLQ